nr:hypothetical protein [Nostoc sp. EkiNYC01]
MFFVIAAVAHIWHQATLKLARTRLYLQNQSFKTRQTYLSTLEDNDDWSDILQQFLGN